MKRNKEEIKQHSYKGYYLYIAKIATYLSGTWYTGYIEIPEGHPIYKKHYDDVGIPVHGGWTYSEPYLGDKKDSWFIGFDTAHSFYDETTQNEEYVLSELKKVVDILE